MKNLAGNCPPPDSDWFRPPSVEKRGRHVKLKIIKQHRVEDVVQFAQQFSAWLLFTSGQVSDIQSSGHAPSAPSESAIIATLQPVNYTAIVRGNALVEVYDLQ